MTRRSKAARIIEAAVTSGTLAVGTLAVGASGVAGATTKVHATASSTQVNCTNAAKRLARIQTLEAKLQELQPQVATWANEAGQDGMARLAGRLQRLDARVKTRSSRLQQSQQRVQQACPAAGSSSG